MNAHPRPEKLYCYVDETGQDTSGRLFLVTTVIMTEDRERLRELLRRVELSSGKGQKKWTKATRRQRQGYMEHVIQTPAFQGKLFYARFEQTTDYLFHVVYTIAQTITTAAATSAYQATVLIDLYFPLS